MKKLLVLPALVSLFAVSAFQGDAESRKSPVAYIVHEAVKDPTLKSNESAFIFTFKNGESFVTDSIQLSDNGKARKVKPDANGNFTMKTEPGKHRFQFFYNSNFFEIYTDTIAVKPRYRTPVEVRFQTALYEVISDKPVIYIYPETTKNIRVQLDVKGTLGFSYPEYKNGWNFTADPDGTIRMNGKQYDYLFWDGATTVNAATTNWNEGFVVKKNELIPFFEKQLAAMGLSPREMNDFITYWCPRMQANETSYVHFEFNAAYESVSSMHITPKPDQLFRMYMIWGDGNGMDAATLKPQQLEKVTRSGFTVVEWGGTELKNIPQQLVITK